MSRFVLLLLLLTCFPQVRAEEPWDPLEGMNRGIFTFNDRADRYVLEPVAEGYDWLFPQPVKKGVKNFFGNLRYPSFLLSDIIQFKFSQVLDHTARFLVNSTIGVAGFIDVAKMWGLEEEEEDFGTALAYHGTPAGPYLVIPFLGPSNVRDAFGLAVDSFLNPLQGIYYFDWGHMNSTDQWIFTGSFRSVQFVSTRASLIDAIRTAREASMDYYLFLQGAYYQHRAGVIWDGNPPEDKDNLGYPEDEAEAAEGK